MTVVACGMMLIMRFCGNTLVGLFAHEADVIAMGGQTLRITSLFYFSLGLIYVCRAY